jgi:hypothetical protein
LDALSGATVKPAPFRRFLIEIAKRDLISAIMSNDRIKEEAARIVADDLAHARLLRQRIAVAAEQLEASTLEEAALVMRAAAAYSTVLKNTSDMLRHVMPLERATEQVMEQDRPELTIRELSLEEAVAMRKKATEEVD